MTCISNQVAQLIKKSTKVRKNKDLEDIKLTR